MAPRALVPAPLKADSTAKYHLVNTSAAVDNELEDYEITPRMFVVIYEHHFKKGEPFKRSPEANDGRNYSYKFKTIIEQHRWVPDENNIYSGRVTAQHLGFNGNPPRTPFPLTRHILGQDVNAKKIVGNRSMGFHNLEAGTMVQIMSNAYSGPLSNYESRAVSSGVGWYDIAICVKRPRQEEVWGCDELPFEYFRLA